ncbi:universal stress protein [Candidatus Poriferisocius sp.]
MVGARFGGWVGEFRGLLLGSVSQQITHQGSCPVVIVRPDLPT